jgi:hypothetical protein
VGKKRLAHPTTDRFLNEFRNPIFGKNRISFLYSSKSSNLTGFENLSGFFCPYNRIKGQARIILGLGQKPTTLGLSFGEPNP